MAENSQENFVKKKKLSQDWYYLILKDFVDRYSEK